MGAKDAVNMRVIARLRPVNAREKRVYFRAVCH